MAYTFQISKHAEKRLSQRNIVLPFLNKLKSLTNKEVSRISKNHKSNDYTYFKGKEINFLGTPIYVCKRIKSRTYKLITAFYKN